MNRRVLYIVIVIAVLVLGIFVVRPMLTRRPAPAPARAKKKTTDTTAQAQKKPARATRASRAAERKAASKRETKTETPASAPAAESLAPQPARVETTELAWGSDPFVRDWLMAGELRDLKLRAVSLGERPLALINDRVVARGDTVNGKRVAAITRDSVVFEFGGQTRGLKIGE